MRTLYGSGLLTMLLSYDDVKIGMKRKRSNVIAKVRKSGAVDENRCQLHQGLDGNDISFKC